MRYLGIDEVRKLRKELKAAKQYLRSSPEGIYAKEMNRIIIDATKELEYPLSPFHPGRPRGVGKITAPANKATGRRIEGKIANMLGTHRIGIAGKEDFKFFAFNRTWVGEAKSRVNSVVTKWFSQAKQYTQEGESPMVFLHATGGSWNTETYAMMYFNDFLALKEMFKRVYQDSEELKIRGALIEGPEEMGTYNVEVNGR